jgi:probable HAF family extracellular repeat protein
MRAEEVVHKQRLLATEFVQETYHCPECQRRTPGTGQGGRMTIMQREQRQWAVLAALFLLPLAGCGGGASTPQSNILEDNTGNGDDGLAHRDAYVITDLGTGNASPVTLNSGGAVTHNYTFWQNGKNTQIVSLGKGYALSRAINDVGQIVGMSDTGKLDSQGGVVSHAFLYANGATTDLGVLPGTASDYHDHSEALGISNTGQVVGRSGGYAGDAHAFLWQNGKMSDIGANTGESSATSINDAGQIVGYQALGLENHSAIVHAVLWQSGKQIDLGTLPGHKGSLATAINKSGLVVGRSTPGPALDGFPTADGGPQGLHAVQWRNGQIADLGTLGGPISQAFGVNSAGQVVGQADTKTFITFPPNPEVSCGPGCGRYIAHAFLYKDGKMVDLNTLVAANTGWAFDEADAINDRGQIVGIGMYKGDGHYFLLTPK